MRDSEGGHCTQCRCLKSLERNPDSLIISFTKPGRTYSSKSRQASKTSTPPPMVSKSLESCLKNHVLVFLTKAKNCLSGEVS